MQFNFRILKKRYDKNRLAGTLLLFLFAFGALTTNSCSTLNTFPKGQDTKPSDGNQKPAYSWSSFFNNSCGPRVVFKTNGKDEAFLVYPCSNKKALSQYATKLRRFNAVQMWAVSDLPTEQLYQLSKSKCRASLIYVGRAYATIKFPCALVHMTVTYEIVDRKTHNGRMQIQLRPTKVLLTYGDGVQEFTVQGERLVPDGPFKPFQSPAPKITFLSDFPYTQCSQKTQKARPREDHRLFSFLEICKRPVAEISHIQF